MCDEIALELSVTNTGSGVARDIVVVTELSEGLATAAGDPTARLTVESLAAGQSRTLRVEARAAAPGSYQAVATDSPQAASTFKFYQMEVELTPVPAAR